MKSQFGELLSELRAKYGFTQKKLAEKLFVSDKAVSKWERGVCLPDISIIRKLSVIFDLDIETLLLGKINNNKSPWIGMIDIKENNEIDLTTSIDNKPFVLILISYFLLANITEIIIFCNTQEYEEVLDSTTKISDKISVSVTVSKPERYLKSNEEHLKAKNIMLISKPYFIFGAGLTYAFQKSMSKGGQYTVIVSPCADISDERSLKHTDENMPKYRDIPIVFADYETIKDLYAGSETRINRISENRRIETLNRGFIEININNREKLKDAEKIITCIEKYSDMKVYDPKYIIDHKCL